MNKKLFFISFTIPMCFSLVGCSGSSNLELLKFETIEEKDFPKNERHMAHELDDDVILLDSSTELLLKAVVKNDDRKSFIDVVLYSSELNTKVVFNEGNGEYQCSSTTIFEDNQWVTNIFLKFTVTSELGELSIDEIGFLSLDNSKENAVIKNDKNKTIKYHVHNYEEIEVLIPKTDYSDGKSKKLCEYCGSLIEAVVPSTANECHDDFVYELSDDETSYNIQKYIGEDKHERVALPEEHEGLPIAIQGSPFTLTDSSEQKKISFKELVIPETIDTLGPAQLMGATMETLYLPKTFKQFGLSWAGISPFVGMANLKNYVVDEENEQLVSVDGIVYDKNQTKLVAYPSGRKGVVNIPNVTELGEWCLSCSTISELNIPLSVTKIGRCALAYLDDPLTINYAGTVAQWNEIDGIDSENLYYLTPYTHDIHCSDGIVEY